MGLALPTGTRGRVLALAVTALTAAAVWAGVVAPARDWYADRADLLRREQAMARHMIALVETLPALRREAQELRGDGSGRQADAAGSLLAGATDPLAAASLQQRIDELAGKTGVHVGSEEILPAKAEGDLRAISVRLTVSAPYRSLVALLLAFAQSETPMVADEVLMRGPPVTAAGAPLDPPIDASLTVESYRAATAEPR